MEQYVKGFTPVKISPLASFYCDSFFIAKCDKCYYKVRQVLQSVTILLQSATIVTKCDSTLVVYILIRIVEHWNTWPKM